MSKRHLGITAVLAGTSQSDFARTSGVSQGWINRILTRAGQVTPAPGRSTEPRCDRVPWGAQLHALRQTSATRLAEDGANASEIRRSLGHRSSTTSQNYIEVTAAQTRAAVRANRTNRALDGLVRS